MKETPKSHQKRFEMSLLLQGKCDSCVCQIFLESSLQTWESKEQKNKPCPDMIREKTFLDKNTQKSTFKTFVRLSGISFRILLQFTVRFFFKKKPPFPLQHISVGFSWATSRESENYQLFDDQALLWNTTLMRNARSVLEAARHRVCLGIKFWAMT